MALHRWPAFKPPSQNCNPTFLNPNMASYSQPINIIPTNGARYQVTQPIYPNDQMRMMNIPRPMITHQVMIVSTLTHYPTPAMINTQASTTPTTNNQPRIPFYHQPPKQTSDLAYQNLPRYQPQQQQHQQPSIQQQQQTAQSPNPFINMASPKTSKRALRRKKQRLKLQLSIINNKTATQHQEGPIENQLQKDKITITDEIASKSIAIEDQTDNQSSMQTQ